MSRSALLVGLLAVAGSAAFSPSPAAADPDQTLLVSRGYDGLPGSSATDYYADSVGPVIADDGQHVAFTSSAPNMWSGDMLGQRQGFIRDLRGGGNVLVTRDTGAAGALSDNGGGINGIPAYATGLAADGSSVYFTAVLPSASGRDYGYRRDLATGVTELVTKAYDGTPVTPGGWVQPVGDGRYVLFDSYQQVVPSYVPAPGQGGLYLRDVRSGAVTLVSRADGQDGAPDTYNYPAFAGASPGGRWIAFRSGAPDLAPGPAAPTIQGGGATYVYLRDVRYGRTLLVSRANGMLGTPIAGSYAEAPVTADGCIVAFDAQGIGIADYGPGNGGTEAYQRNVCRGTTRLVSRADAAHGGLAARTPVPSGSVDGAVQTQGMSADGRYVLFTTNATNLADGVNVRSPDVYVRDMASDRIILVSRADGPAGAPDTDNTGHYTGATMTPDAKYVAFGSKGTNLITPSPVTAQVYRRELAGIAPVAIAPRCGPTDDPGLAPPALPACPGDGTGDGGGSTPGSGDGGLPVTPTPVTVPVSPPAAGTAVPTTTTTPDPSAPIVATVPTLVRAPELSAVRATSARVTAWLTLPATVDVTIARAVTGRSHRTTWRTRPPAVKAIIKTAGRIAVRLPKLPAARYRLTIRAVGLAGARSAAVTRTLDLRPKKKKDTKK
jgi:hypothetical protein